MTRASRHGAPLLAVVVVVAVLAVAPPAAANVPDPITRTGPVRATATGAADGMLTTQVAYTGTTATATASTGDTISLGGGFVFRLRTCVAHHLHGALPVSRCAERTVDTSASTGAVTTHAPTVTLSGQPRPTTQPWGYFTPYTEVLYRSAGSWALLAHSWPDDGLQGAAVAVAAQDQTTGTLPPDSTVTLDGPFSGAINTGQSDSICTDQPVAPDGSTLPAGVTSSHAAFPGAPAYYEVGLPTGAHAGREPLGVVLVIHGGGWTLDGVGAAQSVRPDADRWRARGWETVNLTYRGCGRSVDDVLWFYDHARAWFGGAAQICALGGSAGGHLALLVGADRPDLYCAVSMGGPTDLRTIAGEGTYDTATGRHDATFGGRWVHNLAAAAFGEENLPLYSPAALATPTLSSTRVLQAFAAHDPTVPFQQATDLADAMRAANPDAYVDTLQLAAGSIRFVHAPVTQAALDRLYARELQLVAPVSAPTVPLDRR